MEFSTAFPVVSANAGVVPFDVVEGLMVTSRVTTSNMGMFNIKGKGNQQAWTTTDAVRILQAQGAVIQ
jgi:hypothetical protein